MKPKLSLFFGSLAMLTNANCGPNSVAETPVDSLAQSIRCASCNTEYNGSGVHVLSALPYSQFGLQDPIAPWYVTGFKNVGGSVLATGWRGANTLDAQVVSAQWRGRSYRLVELTVNRTQLQATLASGLTSQTVTGDQFGSDGLILNLSIPAPIFAGLYSTRQLRIRSESGFDTKSYPNAGGVTGYTVEYQRIIPGFWDNHCGNLTAREKSIFLGGSLWDPFDASRTDGDNLVTLSCESGAVGRCAMWGYPPYAKDGSGYDASSARDYHQSCIYLKRAAYCGTDKTNDANEMPIQMSERFPYNQIDANLDNTDHLEALWGPSGALCVTTTTVHRRNRFNNFLPFSSIRCLDSVNGLRALPDCTNELLTGNPTAIRSKYLDPIDMQVHRVNQTAQAISTIYGDMSSWFDTLTGAFIPGVNSYGSDGTYQTAAVNP